MFGNMKKFIISKCKHLVNKILPVLIQVLIKLIKTFFNIN
jgi:hypothetical protein